MIFFSVQWFSQCTQNVVENIRYFPTGTVSPERRSLMSLEGRESEVCGGEGCGRNSPATWTDTNPCLFIICIIGIG